MKMKSASDEVRRINWTVRLAAAVLLVLVPLVGGAAAGIRFPPISDTEARAIGEGVLHNETGGDPRKLLWWNAGEGFASLGIGHFIWYPAALDDRFEESFPALIAFARERGVTPPAWLAGDASLDCPWKDRDAFIAARDEPRTRELERWLARTVALQTHFLVARIKSTIPQVIEAVPDDRRRIVAARIEALALDPRGRFALIDYVNFKGTGLAPGERYAGQGWGLLQVIEEMADGGCPAAGFADAAQRVLERRVRSSPPAREEERWLPGWRARVRTYGEGCGRDGR
jgi:hypothetical protein